MQTSTSEERSKKKNSFEFPLYRHTHGVTLCNSSFPHLCSNFVNLSIEIFFLGDFNLFKFSEKRKSLILYFRNFMT